MQHVKPYMVTLSMRAPTAKFIEERLVVAPLRTAPSGAEADLAREIARGMSVKKTRAQLRLPLQLPLLRQVQTLLMELIRLAPYNVATALERVAADIEKAISTSVVDHLVRYVRQVDPAMIA